MNVSELLPLRDEQADLFGALSRREVYAALPDDDITVLLALEDGEVWTGFHDSEDDCWRYVSADIVEVDVTHWADLPPHPRDAA